MYKCTGCGVALQDVDSQSIGYTKNIENKLCERCFKIKNYNKYTSVTKDNNDYIKILNKISSTDDLVVLVVDLFNISKNIEFIGNIIKNDVLLVLSKRDVLPKSCYDKKFIDYFSDINLNIVNTEIISSKKNMNFDSLYSKINKYKKSKNVYVVGFTNVGKSTMINRIIYNYSDNDCEITTSNIPSTTLDSINIEINETLTLIDTPGIIDEGDISNYIALDELKCIQPNKEIKPITYQIKGNQTILLGNYSYIEASNVNITIYISNLIDVERVYKTKKVLPEMKKHVIHVKECEDIVIQGLGFINISHECDIIIYVRERVSVYTRKELI